MNTFHEQLSMERYPKEATDPIMSRYANAVLIDI